MKQPPTKTRGRRGHRAFCGECWPGNEQGATSRAQRAGRSEPNLVEAGRGSVPLPFEFGRISYPNSMISLFEGRTIGNQADSAKAERKYVILRLMRIGSHGI